MSPGNLARTALAIMIALGPPARCAAGGAIDGLVARMTLDEKIGQMTLLTTDWEVTGPSVRGDYEELIATGRVGALFNAYTAAFTRRLQEKAVAGSRLGLPLLFGYDVIHGHRTIFPIPLGETATWNLEAIEGAARIAAREATAEGLHWTFAPMVDIARDARWGRIAEGAGEDVFLGSAVARARVRGFQGRDLGAVDTMLACAKHFAAYGAAQAGRDYHTVDLSRQTLEEVYLPPFESAVEAGVATVMTAFNEVNGIPATANRFLLTDVLRKRWGFTGFVVTDYTSINELVAHGFAGDEREAGLLSIRAGVDMDMQGSVFLKHLRDDVTAGSVPVAAVDDAVRRILELKASLGLLDDPFRYCDPEREAAVVMQPRHLEFARTVAAESFVLLKNEGPLLPLPARPGRIAVVGPLADSKRDALGSWSAAGDAARAVDFLQALRARLEGTSRIDHAPGCSVAGPETAGIPAAVAAAREADVVLAVCGESADMSGEAASRSRLDLPGVQRQLLERLVETGKPVILILMNGRPLALEWEARHLPVILEAWFPGTMGGPALVDVLFGDRSPAGRLPVTFPRHVGQVPIFHAVKATGRPVDPARPDEKYRSRYLDTPNDPLFPFGHGLTYTRFRYSDLELSTGTAGPAGILGASVLLSNDGERPGTEVVQLYIHDLAGTRTRPVRELRGFQRVPLEPGAARKVEFTLGARDLAYPRDDGPPRAEPGAFDLFIGPDAASGLRARFVLEPGGEIRLDPAP